MDNRPPFSADITHGSEEKDVALGRWRLAPAHELWRGKNGRVLTGPDGGGLGTQRASDELFSKTAGANGLLEQSLVPRLTHDSALASRKYTAQHRPHTAIVMLVGEEPRR